MHETGSDREGTPSFRAAYREAMDRVVLTEEMRERVLTAVSGKGRKRTGKVSVFRTPAGRILPLLVAAAVIFVLYAAVLPGTKRTTQEETAPSVAGGFYTEEEESLSALSDAAGYSVRTLSDLPFAVSDTAYTYYSDGMAQITWTGEAGETCTLRMAEGTEDVSGDYNSYKESREVSLFGQSVTLSGTGDGTFVLARWTDGTYAYSIRMTDAAGNGCSQADWEKLKLD